MRVLTADMLFAKAQEIFEQFLEELRSYGLEIGQSPIQLKRGDGILCYYDLQDGCIYLSLPDSSTPAGKLRSLFLCSLVGSENEAQMMELIELMMPRLIGHELGHYFRHRGDFFGDDLWLEEQIANQLANAVTKYRYRPAQKRKLVGYLKQGLDSLSKRMDSPNRAVDAYHDPLKALSATGVIKSSVVESVETMNLLFATQPEDMLRDSGEGSLLHGRIGKRDDLISDFNSNYTSDVTAYLHYQFTWNLVDLESNEYHYVDEIASKYLGQEEPKLPLLEPTASCTRKQLVACYAASRVAAEISETASRYFYKRYRSLLIRALEDSQSVENSRQAVWKREARVVLETWNWEESEALEFTTFLAPAELRPYFPQFIGEKVSEVGDITPFLPQETDRRLWEYLMGNFSDRGAANSLRRLHVVDGAQIFAGLPAEILLELAHSLFEIHVREEETLIWEGTAHYDVFVLTSGILDVSVYRDGTERKVGHILAGEVFGEVSFFTRRPRSATVQARVPSECFVLRAMDLRLMAFRYPTVLMGMGNALADRLREIQTVSGVS